MKDRVVLSLIPKEAKNILDIGCGEGISLQHFANAFPNASVIGVDYLNENVAICQQYKLSCLKGDVYNLDFQDKSIDAVIFMEVIEHLDYPGKAIREIFRILKPSGILVIGFPNDLFFLLARIFLLKFKEARYDPGHVKQWTPQAMKKTLEEHGFTNIITKCLPIGLWPVSLHCIIVAKKIISYIPESNSGK